jgi:glycine/D-amino acid oxidase-like deaminating enzyme
VLAGFSGILRDLNVRCDLTLPGALEIGRQGVLPNSPIQWNDSGTLGVTREVPGGTINPGKMLSGLAQTASRGGALIFENAPVTSVSLEKSPVLNINGEIVRARRVLLATNAESLELSGLAGHAQPKFTLAVATEPLSQDQLSSLGIAQGKPFYTIDLPYLWGRVFDQNRVIFGSGLVHLEDWRELLTLNVAEGHPAELLADLDRRVRDLHPVLRGVRLSHRWGGPILIADKWEPVFRRHAQHKDVIVLGAYSGHGVALSVYLGAWAAEAMLGKKDIPRWEEDATAAD